MNNLMIKRTVFDIFIWHFWLFMVVQTLNAKVAWIYLRDSSFGENIVYASSALQELDEALKAIYNFNSVK